MYGKAASLASGATASGALAYTGVFNVAWALVAGVTLLMAGFAVMKLTPRRKRADVE